MFYSYSDASVIGLNGIVKPALLNYNFYCNGDEARLTDCVVTGINKKNCGNGRLGLVCETGNIHQLVCIF